MFSDPESNLRGLGVAPGMTVADFGSGAGFYVLAASKMVAPDGRVYAVEIQKDLLERLKNLLSREGVGNVSVVWGDVENPGGCHLKNSSVDAVIVSNILFQVENKEGLVKEALRILKPNGRILLVDWKDAGAVGGPPLSDIVSKNEAIDLFSASGLEAIDEVDAGAGHYGLIFARK